MVRHYFSLIRGTTDSPDAYLDYLTVTIWLGLFIGNNQTINDQQMSETLAAIKIYGTSLIGGVIIGNE